MRDEPKLIRMPTFSSNFGNLSIVDKTNVLPFELKRIFYVYGIPSGSKRGDHAHKNLKEFIWCLKGKIEVFTIMISGEKNNFLLDEPNIGLYIPSKTWSYQTILSADSIYCVGCSEYYYEDDYIRNYSEFEKFLIDS